LHRLFLTRHARLHSRLHGVESRQQEREERDAVALRGVRDRVDRIETGRDASERLRLEGQSAILSRLGALEERLQSAPAAPRP